ncbi:MAG: BACON domain-containing protein [Rikenellaceae bacterium]
MNKILILIACAIFGVSCQAVESDTGVSNIDISLNKLEFNYTSGTQEVTLSSNGNWQLENPCGWIRVNPEMGTYGDDNVIEITVSENTSSEILSYTLIFSTGDATSSVLVEQAAFQGDYNQEEE